jgi:hypothetical protein
MKLIYQGELVQSDDLLDLGHLLLQNSFNPHLHRHSSTWAALTGALQTNVNRIILIYTDQLDVAAMALEGAPKVVDGILNLFLECLVRISFAATTVFAHNKSPI